MIECYFCRTVINSELNALLTELGWEIFELANGLLYVVCPHCVYERKL
jgi:hypothetical protein